MCERLGSCMLLDLSLDLVKLRRAGGHHSHGTGTVARSDANCDLLFPKQGMRAHAPASKRPSELGDAQTPPPSFCRLPCLHAAVSPRRLFQSPQRNPPMTAKNPCDRLPAAHLKDHAFSGTGPAVSPRRSTTSPAKSSSLNAPSITELPGHLSATLRPAVCPRKSAISPAKSSGSTQRPIRPSGT